MIQWKYGGEENGKNFKDTQVAEDTKVLPGAPALNGVQENV
jgi:hypothetical protein